MRLVTFTTADLERFKKALEKVRSPAPPLHHESMVVDDVGIALVRLRDSNDARTNTYCLGFKCADTDYQFVVRPTVHGVPSITLNVIRKGAGETGTYQFNSYSVVEDTVTTIKAQVANPPRAAEDRPKVTGEVPFDFFEQMLELMKVE
jgi:hypothetical protein